MRLSGTLGPYGNMHDSPKRDSWSLKRPAPRWTVLAASEKAGVMERILSTLGSYNTSIYATNQNLNPSSNTWISHIY